MQIDFTPRAKEELEFWKRTGQKVILKKIPELIRAITESPFEGIGKPEPLKHSLSGAWSRRISGEHRLVYELEGEHLTILSIERFLNKLYTFFQKKCASLRGT